MIRRILRYLEARLDLDERFLELRKAEYESNRQRNDLDNQYTTLLLEERRADLEARSQLLKADAFIRELSDRVTALEATALAGTDKEGG